MGTFNVEEAIAFLQKKSTTDGDSVFCHLSHLIHYILKTKPNDAVDLLETSILLKQTRLLFDDGPRLPLERKDTDEEHTLQLFLKLFGVTNKIPGELHAEAEEDREPEGANLESSGDVQDFLSESTMFETVGVGLGHTETYFIVLALKQLSTKFGIQKTRFFGKFFGISSNYYVFETSMTEDEEVEKVASEGKEEELLFGRPIESVPPEKGVGSNEYVYWICRKLGEEFYRLPDVTPLQITTARLIKRFLTGDLKAEVSAYPPYPGVEENYLRAQIARISANTVLSPKGYFKVAEVEDDEEPGGGIQKSEDWITPLAAELAKLESWVHRNPHIRKNGRCTVYVPQTEEPQDGQEEMGEEASKDEEETEQDPELLVTIENDSELAQGIKPWSIALSSNICYMKHQTVCVRSMVWPGAYVVSAKDGYSNIYIGWGLKNSPYEPPLPPQLQKEYEAELIESQELPLIVKPETHEQPTESESEHEEELISEGEDG